MANRSEQKVLSPNSNAHTAIPRSQGNKNILDSCLSRLFHVFVDENGSNLSLTWSPISYFAPTRRRSPTLDENAGLLLECFFRVETTGCGSGIARRYGKEHDVLASRKLLTTTAKLTGNMLAHFQRRVCLEANPLRTPLCGNKQRRFFSGHSDGSNLGHDLDSCYKDSIAITPISVSNIPVAWSYRSVGKIVSIHT